MLIRKNTKAFKSIVHLVKACQSRPDRQKLIRLYITKAGQSIRDRINTEAIEGEATVFYDMGYETVLSNLESPGHQLHLSEETPGIYYFRSSLSKTWDESPFEFDESITKEFKALPDLPMSRKKEKSEKFIFPTPKTKVATPTAKKLKAPASKVIKNVKEESAQPNFKLEHKLPFTDLEKIIFRQPKLNKLDVLTYYNKIADQILPHLKDRPQFVRLSGDSARKPVELSMALLDDTDADEIPVWIKAVKPSKEDDAAFIVSNDKEQLLFCVELGCVEFNPWHARIKNIENPDYMLILIDSPAFEVDKAVRVAQATNEILTGLQLPSFIKTDGKSGLHIYIPMHSKSMFETSNNVAAFLCKLIQLKIPDLVTLEGAENYTYGKVTLGYAVNDYGKGCVAPYSLVMGETATVATPLLWNEVKEGLRFDDFNPETILQRLKHIGDPFESFYKKKVDAVLLLERLEKYYSFLL
jgi:DNA ligase D-like protein (predicted polymerase)